MFVSPCSIHGDATVYCEDMKTKDESVRTCENRLSEQPGIQNAPPSGSRIGTDAASVSNDFARVAMLFAAFLAFFLASWPTVLSFDLWGFKDRGSFLNLDYLLEKHLRLGVDTYYAYGLLPVFIQHWMFVIFGRTHWPVIGLGIVYLLLMAVFWGASFASSQQVALLVDCLDANRTAGHLGRPYSLSLAAPIIDSFLLAFRATRTPRPCVCYRFDGCFAHPSMTLVLTALVGMAILTQWITNADRSIRALAREFAPGAIAGIVLATTLGLAFGWRSLLVTLSPFNGRAHYQAVHYGFFRSGLPFWHPKGVNFKYYLGSPAGWWLVSTFLLAGLAVLAVIGVLRRRRLDPAATFVIFCACIQVVYYRFRVRSD